MVGSVEDSFLTARELFDLDLSAELVGLSACDTGRGQRRGGEGVIGLAWALSAEIPSQVVSQWAANDSNTAELMTAVYAGLKRNQPKSAALRTAALEGMQDPRHPHLYYWAPFVLMGDWR
jgi:CHAT domain-containing protein